MLVVDSSVWIDHFRGVETAEVALLRSRLDAPCGVALTGVVRTEVLRGAPDEHVAALACQLDEVVNLETARPDYDHAAALYRAARSAGMTVRSVVDCLIAAVCIRLGVPILHNDIDFDKLAAVSDLRVVAR